MIHKRLLAMLLVVTMTVPMTVTAADSTLLQDAMRQQETDAPETSGTTSPFDAILDALNEAFGLKEPAAAEESIDIPELGEEIHGFTVTDISEYEERDAMLVSMDHEQSGAQLLWIANDDANKGVHFYFKTEATDDSGIMHIFEHTTLSGSDKYDNAYLMYQMASGTYNTYLNATTMPQMTTYDMSSLSDDQLLTYVDYYMSGLTDPNALKDEMVLRSEAYRYVLEDAEDDLTVTGALYSEMESINADRSSYAYYQTMKFLYPDSIMSSNCGGVREEITSVTLDDIKAYYNNYYHPSNMLIVMYGDLDLERYLELLDEDYLSNYEAREITHTQGDYIPWTGFRQGTVSYPATEDSSTEDSSIVTYAISLGDISLYDAALLGIVADVLSQDGSTLQQAVQEAFPYASMSVGVNLTVEQPVFEFDLEYCNPDDAAQFYEIVRTALREIAENGLDQDALASCVEQVQVTNAIEAEASDGDTLNTLCRNVGMYWSLEGDRLAFMDYVQAFRDLEKAADGTMDELLQEYVIDPAQSTLLEINPEPGLREEIDEAYAEQLAARKASMSEEEIAALIEETAAYDAWSDEQEEASKTMLADLPRIDLDTLAYDRQDITIDEETIADSIYMLSYAIDNVPYIDSNLYLDLSGLEFDEILDAVFLAEILGGMPTENLAMDEVSALISRNTYALYTYPVVRYDEAEDGAPHPYLAIQSIGYADRVQDMYDVIEELLHTDFSDIDALRSNAAVLASESLSSFNADAYNEAFTVAQALADEDYRYEAYINSIPSMNYYENVAAMSDDELTALGERLNALRDQLLNRQNMIYRVVSTEEAIDAGREAVGELTATFRNAGITPMDYREDLAAYYNADRVAVTTTDSVNYNMILAQSEDIGLSGSGKDQVLMQALYNTQLWPAFRYRIGAYGVFANSGDDFTYICSYRDPSVAEAYDYYDNEMIGDDAMTATEDDIYNAALSVIAGYTEPASERDTALYEMSYLIDHWDTTYADDMTQHVEEARSVTAEDVEAFTEPLRQLVDKGVRVTFGSVSAINQNKDLFHEVLTDLTSAE